MILLQFLKRIFAPLFSPTRDPNEDYVVLYEMGTCPKCHHNEFDIRHDLPQDSTLDFLAFCAKCRTLWGIRDYNHEALELDN